MLSRRGHRLSRFRKNKRRLRERLRQRIFFRDKVVPEAMEKPRVLVLTGAGDFCGIGYSYLSRRRWPVGRTSG